MFEKYKKKHEEDILSIIQDVSEPALYEQMAEECSELCKALLKKARKLRNENYTPQRLNKIDVDIIEELGDLILCAVVLDVNPDFRIVDTKLERWIVRNKLLEQQLTFADLNLLISHFRYIPEEIVISIDKDCIIFNRKGRGTILCIINMTTEKVEIYDRNWLRDIDIQLGQHIIYATAPFDVIFKKDFNKKLRKDLRSYIRTDVVSTHK